MAGRHARRNGLEETSPEKSSRKKWVILSIILIIVIIIGGAGYYFLTQPLTHHTKYPSFFSNAAQNQAANSTGPPAMAPTDNSQRENILLIGTDTRPGEVGGNTDALILASLDAKNHRIELLSIPRDAKVMYPDGSYAKINEGLMLGGPQLTKKLVEELTGQRIDHYALTHFGGLVDIINTVGGITVDVAEPMHYNTGDKEYNIIDLNPGVQTLNGVQALGFVRFRHDALGDIGRTERQQQFLKALEKKLLQPANITKLPTLVREFWGTIDSDMTLLNVLQLASHANDYKDYKVISETLPGSFHNPTSKTDQSYWIVNPVQAKWTAQQFFENGLVQSNPVQVPAVTQNWTPPTHTSTSNSTGTSNSSTDNSPTSNTTGSSGQTAGNTASTGNTTNFHVTPTMQHVMTVNASSVFIRSGPGTNYPVIASALHGQSVTVIGTSGRWDEVIVGNGQDGFVYGSLLDATG